MKYTVGEVVQLENSDGLTSQARITHRLTFGGKNYYTVTLSTGLTLSVEEYELDQGYLRGT